MKLKIVTHKFVENIPDKLNSGILYISIPYTTTAHLCCCGCEEEVITPLSSTDWELLFNGESVSLFPSIGNWNFACRSHYWIEKNKVKWGGNMSSQQIKVVRLRDKIAKENHYSKKPKNEEMSQVLSKQQISNKMKKLSIFEQLTRTIKTFWK